MFLIGGKDPIWRGALFASALAGTGPLPPVRPAVAESESLGFSAHSFLYQAVAPGGYGNLGAYWTGELDIAYAEFSSLKQRWDANGVDRTGNYSGALIVTEIGDLQTGLADPASAQGIETLQTLFWYALTAQAKGCKLLGIYIPHSPEGVNIDADALTKVQYWLGWLRARPEITIPVYAIPAPVMVRAMIDQFNPVIAPYLNDPAAVVTAMTVGGVSENSLSYTTTGSAAAYAIPIPPAGSVIDFDITCSNTTYFRLDGDTDMTSPNHTDLVSGGIAAGTQHVKVTVPSYTDRNFIGFRNPNGGVTVQITNWTVKPPPVSIYADGLHLKTPVYGAPNQMNNAMGQMVRMFLTGARPTDDPAWNAELVGLVDTAWGILQAYEMTGFGGGTAVAPYPVATDPLPSPLPLPGV